ncbi:hypothetical protein C0V75_19095 [Tabrizicola sp. TH137]|uniref:hypothetical protein n=1 Tax=Tabrizicola sp. TH137 TaxID=2067452 RepID=UPI000C7CF8F4|nr:hypothetical protein [Tabrizicola sp. TH137]PLL10796.1 hypothetical protein C0V75_19095 [Tabrizicola sp. TH137]
MKHAPGRDTGRGPLRDDVLHMAMEDMYDRELTELQILIGQWANTGRVDVKDWGANEVMTILSGRPEFREKFVALLEMRLGKPVQ